jgi:hypothetical protein
MLNDVQSSEPRLTADQRRALFEQFLRCLEREANLTHYRQLWGLQWNVACFAALFVLQNGLLDPGYKAIARVVIVILGSAVSVLSFIGIRAAHKQSQYLIDAINDRLGVHDDNWDKTEFIRPYGDPNSVHKPARTIAAAFPLLLIVFWLLVFLYAWPNVFPARH